MTPGDLLTTLRSEVPSMRALYEEAPQLWDEVPPNNYAVFGEVVRPYLIKKLHSRDNEGDLRNLFAFFEQMARTDNPYLVDLLLVEIVESLRDPRVSDLTSRYAGERVKDLLKLGADRGLRLWITTKFAALLRR